MFSVRTHIFGVIFFCYRFTFSGVFDQSLLEENMAAGFSLQGIGTTDYQSGAAVQQEYMQISFSRSADTAVDESRLSWAPLEVKVNK